MTLAKRLLCPRAVLYFSYDQFAPSTRLMSLPGVVISTGSFRMISLPKSILALGLELHVKPEKSHDVCENMGQIRRRSKFRTKLVGFLQDGNAWSRPYPDNSKSVDQQTPDQSRTKQSVIDRMNSDFQKKYFVPQLCSLLRFHVT